jgi:zona occludens toxin (predicted ATPase)
VHGHRREVHHPSLAVHRVSITAYVGLPRSGKSYTAVEQVIIPAMRLGRIVVTNLPLKWDLVRKDFPRADVREFSIAAVEANPDSIFDMCPNGAVIVIDEVWRLWPAGKKVDKIPEAFKSFLAEHGHRVDAAGNAQSIVLVTQDLAQMAAFARQLVEQTFRTVKLTVLGLQKRYRTDVYQGNPTGQNPPEALRIRQIFGKYEPRVYQYYVSHTMSEAGQGGADERGIDGRGNILKRPLMILAPIFIVVVGGLASWHLLRHRNNFLGVGSPVAGKGVASAGGQDGRGLQTFSSRAVAPASSAPLPYWRVVAVIEGDPPLGGHAWLSDGSAVEVIPLGLCVRPALFWQCPRRGMTLAAWGQVDVGLPLGSR